MTEQTARNILRRRVAKAGGTRKWARQNGFSAAYVSDILLYKRHVSARVAQSIGLRMELATVRTYHRKEKIP